MGGDDDQWVSADRCNSICKLLMPIDSMTLLQVRGANDAMQCCRTRCFNTSSSRYGPSYAPRMDLVWVRKSVVVGVRPSVRPSCPREFVSRLYHQSVTALFCFLSSHHGRRIQVPMFLKNCSRFCTQMFAKVERERCVFLSKLLQLWALLNLHIFS